MTQNKIGSYYNLLYHLIVDEKNKFVGRNLLTLYLFSIILSLFGIIDRYILLTIEFNGLIVVSVCSVPTLSVLFFVSTNMNFPHWYKEKHKIAYQIGIWLFLISIFILAFNNFWNHDVEVWSRWMNSKMKHFLYIAILPSVKCFNSSF